MIVVYERDPVLQAAEHRAIGETGNRNRLRLRRFQRLLRIIRPVRLPERISLVPERSPSYTIILRW